MDQLKSFFSDYFASEQTSSFQDERTAVNDKAVQLCSDDKSSFAKKGERLLQNLKICAVTAMSYLIQYTRAIDKNNAELILLVPLNGMVIIDEGGDDPVYCHPGDALLVAVDLIHQVHIANTVSLAIIDIPATLAALQPADPLDDCPIRKISGASIPALQLLVGYTKMLMQMGDNLSPDLTLLVSTQIHDLATLLLGQKQEETQVTNKCSLRAARFEAVKHDILEHIAESELSITQVARRQGISPQYIRTLFHCKETTFADYVTNLRLEHAYQHLCNPAYSDCCISTVAFDMGFNNLSWFNRAFKQRFNLTPSEVRNLSKRSANQ